MAKRIEWTDQRKARLRQLLVDEGLTYREAARRMNLRYNQVKQAALTYRLGNHAPRYAWREWDRDEYDTLERLLEQGHTYPQIAEAMSLTPNQVKGAAQRLGMMSQERLGMHRVRARAEANAKRRKVAVGQRIQRARAAKRNQEAAA